MAFDKNKPAGSQELRKSDDEIRANWSALETAISEGHEFTTGGNQTGYHVTPTWKDSGGDPTQPTGTNQVRIGNNAETIVGIRQSDGGVLGFGTERGAKSIFKQSTAPLGWSFVSEDNDRALINTSTESNGGATGGNWIISGWSFSVDGHALSEAELPEHKHIVPWGEDQDTFSPPWGLSSYSEKLGTGSVDTNNEYPYTSPVGSGNSHSHGFTSSHDGSWRPSYVKCITCSKD